jgi:hypothetical protein
LAETFAIEGKTSTHSSEQIYMAQLLEVIVLFDITDDQPQTANPNASSTFPKDAHVSDADKSQVNKTRKRRFRKLTGAELAGLPGAVQSAEKVCEADVVYYICFSTPLTGPVGTVTEAAQVHDFVYQLGTHTFNTGVGLVASVSFAVGSTEIVLKLNESGEQTERAAPVVDAFTKLGGFLSSSPILTEQRSGRKASWKAKINGTTIAEGRY